MNSFLQTQWMPLVGDVVVRGTLLLLMAGCLAHLARQNAALRHRLGVLTFVGLLLLPLLSVLAPQWEVPIATRRTPLAETKSFTFLQAKTSSPTASTNPAQSKPSTDVSPQVHGESRSLPAHEPSIRLPTLAQLLFAVWLSGFMVALSRMVLSFVAVRRLQKHGCQTLDSGIIAQQCKRMAEELGIRRPVALCLAAEDAAFMPMTWGWRSPVLLLPSPAPRWSSEQLRSVLLHELSHIRRGDWAAQTLATLCCAFYWFHPLVWCALARLKADAESATDEQVVASGVKASDYCAHLLELAKSGVSGQQTLRYGIPMARGANIEGRLSALLDAKRQRRGTSRVIPLLVTGVLILAVGLVSTLQLRLNAAPVGSSPTPAGAISASNSTTLPDGGSVALVGISSHPSRGKNWWTPKGDLLPVNTFITNGASSSGSPGFKTREFVAALQNVRGDTSWRWRTQPGTNWAGGDAKFGVKVPTNMAQSQLVALSATVPENLSQLTVQLGVANDIWQRKSFWYRDWDSQMAPTIPLKRHSVSFSKSVEVDGDTRVTVAHTFFDDDVRIVAVDKSGRPHTATRSEIVRGDTSCRITSTFEGLPIRQVGSFDFETRRYRWVTFPHVALDPSPQASKNQTPLSSLAQLPITDTPSINWRSAGPNMRTGIDVGKNTTTTQAEVPVTLYLSLDKGTPLPKTDWDNTTVWVMGYPRTAPGSKFVMRKVKVKGWKPTGREGEYTALVRQIRFLTKGEWYISAGIRFPIGHNSISSAGVSRHIIVQ